CRIQAGEFALDSRGIGSYPLAIRRSVLNGLWRTISPPSRGLLHRHIQALLALLGAPRGDGSIDLPGGIRAVREGRLVRIGRAGAGRDANGAPASLAIPGRVRRRDVSLASSWVPRAAALGHLRNKAGNEEYFAAEGLQGGLELRDGGADERFV